jgi:hypothetical protein
MTSLRALDPTTRRDSEHVESLSLGLVNRSVSWTQRHDGLRIGTETRSPWLTKMANSLITFVNHVSRRRRDFVTSRRRGWGAGGRLGTGRLRLGMKLPGDAGYLSKLH